MVKNPVNIKEQTKRLRFMLEGPWPLTSFVLCLSDYECRNASIGETLMIQIKPFLFCQFWYTSTSKTANENILKELCYVS